MKNYLIVFLIGIAAVSNAQNYDADSILYTPIQKNGAKKITLIENENTKLIDYFFDVQTGSLIGCNDCGKGRDVTFSIATTHGVTVGKKLRGGLGVGFDSYANWQTFPIFGSVSWDLIGNKNKNAVFVQFSYGWAHPWFVRNNLYNYYQTDPYNAVSGGRMMNPSIGYRLKYYDLKLSIVIGYKCQRIFYKSPPYNSCPMCVPLMFAQNDYDITQEINRLQLMVGIGWK
jgi:hypothetical protein